MPERQHHPVTGPHRRNRATDRFDDARTLMPEQYRPIRCSRNTIHQIGVADTGGFDPNQDLVRRRIVDLDLDEDKRNPDARRTARRW